MDPPCAYVRIDDRQLIKTDELQRQMNAYYDCVEGVLTGRNFRIISDALVVIDETSNDV